MAQHNRAASNGGRAILAVSLAGILGACEVDREPETQAVRATIQRASDRLSDAWITLKIESQLFADADVGAGAIDVETVDGRVTLTGVLQTEAEKTQALSIARTTDGVVAVDDRLFVATDRVGQPTGDGAEKDSDRVITTEVRARFFTDPFIKPWNVDVQTSDGTVLLSGIVDDEAARRRAVELASGVEGVVEVVDRLQTSSGAAPQDAPEAGEPDRRTGAIATIDEFVSDAGITMRLQAKYFTDDALDGSDIDVETASGVVTLSGSVTSEAQRQTAISLARNTSGVVDVQDRLTVAAGSQPGPDTQAGRDSGGATGVAEARSELSDAWITTQITARFFLDEDLRFANVSVDTNDGEVTLSGQANDESVKTRMVEIARAVEGVTDVVDRIVVSPGS